MTWVSDPKLVAAVSNAGGFASLAGGNTPPAILAEQIHKTRELTDKPFAVNLVTLSPAYSEQLAMIRQENVPFVIFAAIPARTLSWLKRRAPRLSALLRRIP